MFSLKIKTNTTLNYTHVLILEILLRKDGINFKKIKKKNIFTPR